jgi:hypothetical protein
MIKLSWEADTRFLEIAGFEFLVGIQDETINQ